MKWFYKKNRVPVIIGAFTMVLILGVSMTVLAGSHSYQSRAQLEKAAELKAQGYSPEEAGRIAESIVEFGYSEADAIAEAEQYFHGSSSTASTPNTSTTPSTPVTPACTHEWVVTDSTDATCIAEGSITYTCSKCGKTKTEAVAKNEHSYELTAQTEATCKDRATETYTCSVCGDTYTLEGEIGEHIYTRSDESVEATCEEAGTTVYVCSVCGDTYSEEVPVLGHEFSKTKVVTQEPTCTEEGKKAYVCSRCGLTKEEETVPATGHTTVYQTLESPTLLHKGRAVDYCTTCKQNITEYELPRIMPVWLPFVAVGGIAAVVIVLVVMVKRGKRK